MPRLAHVADSHLGVKRYHKVAGAINQREADAARAFRIAVDQIIEAAPDVVIHAGDVFDSVTPSNACGLFTYQQFRRLREALPNAPIVVIAGNHSAPRSAGVGSPLRILSEIGVDVATDRAEVFRYPALDLAVLAVPHAALVAGNRPPLQPDGPERYQVMVLHGEVPGVFAEAHGGEYGGAMVDTEDLTGPGWSYVALGHYHVQHQVGPRCWYAGALEYVSSNLWGELADEARLGVRGKGWLAVDLETGAAESRCVPQARPIYDLDPVQAIGLTVDEVTAEMTAAVEGIPGGIEGAIVRLRVLQVDRAVARALDYAAIRRWKAEALELRLDLQKACPEHVSVSVRSRQSVEELVAAYLGSRELPPGMDRGSFCRIGAEVMAEDYGA